MKKIELRDWPEIFRGCVRPGQRMSDSLLDFFNTAPKTFLRARCLSGVRLQFATDSSELEWTLEFGSPVRKIYTTDFLINGELRTVDGPGPHRLELPPGEKDIVIHLPHLVEILNAELKLDDDATFKTMPETRRRIIFCGDSIMQGMTTTSPLRAIAARTAEMLNMDFINTSVGGACMKPDHVRLSAELNGDFLVVALGVNDAISRTEMGQFRRNAEDALKALAEFPGDKLLVLPIPRVASPEPDLKPYRESIRTAASSFPSIPVLDGNDFFPAKAELYCDGTHPNDAGAKIYSDILYQTIKQSKECGK